MPDCPQCGVSFAQRTAGGRPRRFHSVDCRLEWNNKNKVMENQVRWLRGNAEDAEAHARLVSSHSAPGFRRSAARLRREADELEKHLEERRHG